MLTRFSAKQGLKLGTALTGFGIMLPTPAFADCLINATNDTVTCTTADTNGFQSSINLLTINVLPGATVTGTTLSSAAPLLSAGTQSVVNNEGGIDVTGAPAGSVAISLGGGSRVTEASTATGTITGDIMFGSAATGQTNTFQNFNTVATVTGNISSAGGAFVFTNNGGIAGNISSSGATTVTNTGTITGNTTLGAGNDTVTNSGSITGNVALGDGTNSLTNSGTITGNVSAGTGNDTVTNSGTLTGNVALGDGNNTLANSGTITGDVTAGTGNDTLSNNAGLVNGNINLGSGTDSISNLIGTGTITKAGTGTLTLSGNNAGFTNGGTVLNLNGGTVAIGAANNMATGGLVFNGGTLQTTGALTLTNAITLAGAGTVQTDADTTISSNITGAGGLTKTGTARLTLTGVNNYGGGTTVSAGILQGQAGTAIQAISSITRKWTSPAPRRRMPATCRGLALCGYSVPA